MTVIPAVWLILIALQGTHMHVVTNVPIPFPDLPACERAVAALTQNYPSLNGQCLPTK